MDLERRQIWAQPTTSSPTHASCTPFLLPSNGVLTINNSFSLTMTEDAYYQPDCTGTANATDLPSAVIDNEDPFYSSVGPQLYAIGCMTVLSYLLVIILLITPRKFYVGGPGGDANFVGRHGVISGSYSGNSSVIGVGGRPWLQKVAAMSVAISLTLATVDSFHVAEKQYDMGYTDAEAMTETVIDGMELRIVHVVSTTFLWLAQVQTLIRLFPRHKEKVMIKWVGFALIVLDTVFAILDNFVAHGSETHPRLFDDAIPALSYLFELALNMLYAAWVIFYSLSKHRFAFFHPKMRNICLVAMFSLVAILIPVIFFIMDIASPDVAGWGEYIRWVGSAAASVVVWEWVERIEALERDERKDGILGREIFDGDEMLEVTPSQEVDWPGSSNVPGGENGRGTGAAWRGVIALNNKPVRRGHLGFQLGTHARRGTAPETHNRRASLLQTTSDPPVPPPVAVTPISRADTTSAASTVYYVRYHTLASPTPPLSTLPIEDRSQSETQSKQDDISGTTLQSQEIHITDDHEDTTNDLALRSLSSTGWRRWLSVNGLFGNRRTSPPQEIATAQEEEDDEEEEEDSTHYRSSVNDEDNIAEKNGGFTNITSRIQHAVSSFRLSDLQQRFGSRVSKPLTVTVIPSRDLAQQPWSPRPGDGDSGNRLSSAPGLPTTVISTPRRHTSAWPSHPDASGELGGNGQLRYDPDTAALVGVDPAPEFDRREDSRDASSPSTEITVMFDEEPSHPSHADGQHQGPTILNTPMPQEHNISLDDRDLETGSDAHYNRGRH